MAAWLWVCGLIYANTYLTDGFIPEDGLAAVWPWSRAGRYATRLVQVKLWERVKGGYLIHDYLEYNPSAQIIKNKRESDRLRKVPHGIHADSNGNPNGVQPDSARIPSAPSRARVIPSHPILRTKKELANQKQPSRLVDPAVLKAVIEKTKTKDRRMNRNVRFR